MPTIQQLVRNGRVRMEDKSKSPALAKKGQKAFLASLITSILLMCFAAGVAALFF